MYLSDYQEAALRDDGLRDLLGAAAYGPGGQRHTHNAYLGEPPASGPVFDFACPAGGCAPLADAQCRAVLHRAIVSGISLATNAANKLEANPREAETVRLFRFFFGHDPALPIPWAGNMQSGNSVALRFRKVAAEMGGGRRTTYRCGCPADGPTIMAVTEDPFTVRICPRFWNPPPSPGLPADVFRGGTLLHEMLHQLYIEFLRHDANEQRRNNAHCYAAFAWRVAGFGARPSAVNRCMT